jgi:hypothetical protein
MLPMVAVAAAPYLEGIAASRPFRAVLGAFVVLVGALFVGGGAAALLGEPRFELKLETERGLAPSADALWWLLLSAGAAALLVLAGARRLGAMRAAGAALALLVVALFVGTAVLLDDENSARAVMARARGEAGTATVGLVAWKEQNLLQAQGPTVEFGFKRAPAEQFASGLAWLRAEPASRRLFVLAEAMPACVDRGRARFLGTANRRAWYLLDAAATDPCATRAP